VARTALLAILLAAGAARADLYRWVDPETGAVKFSSIAPAPSQAGVELIPYRSQEFEARWRLFLSELERTKDAPSGGDALQKQLRAYDVLRAELDRLDPRGAQRRLAEVQSVIQRLTKK
jgi:Domain of unknown function (DUF4124)